MQQNTTGVRRAGFQLMWHRRVGLTSFVCLMLGTAWLSSVVIPGLQRSNEQRMGKLTGTGIGALNVMALLRGAPIPESTPRPIFSASPTAPAIGTAEISLVNAPVGSALQLLLGSARFSCSTDPSVTGVVTYSCAGSPKPFWEVLGRVIGASPAPGVHVAAIWDSYRVLPRDIKPTRMRDYTSYPAHEPAPVPFGDGRSTHRMVGYVSLKPSDEQPLVQSALLETRIPGLPAQWRMIRVGDALQRKSPQDVARETNAAANVDVTVAVTEISADHVMLRGGGNKYLRIPLSGLGVTDVFGFSASTEPEYRKNSVPTDPIPRSSSDWPR